jgi:WD40 repeat protein
MGHFRACAAVIALAVALMLLAEGRAAAPPQRPLRVDIQGNPLPRGALARMGTLAGRPPGWIASFALSPDGKTLAVCNNDKKSEVYLVSLTTGKVLRVFSGHSHSLTSVGFSADGKSVVSADTDGLVRFWAVETGKEVWRARGDRSVETVVVSPDGKMLATAELGPIRLRDATTGKLLRTLPTPFSSDQRLLFSPDSKALLSSGYGGEVALWETATGKLLRRFALPDGGRVQKAVALSTDGKFVAVGSDANKIYLWEVKTGKALGTFAGHKGGVTAVAFSPDGKTLASYGGDSTVRLWDVSAGKEKRRFAGHREDADGLTFTPDGKLLLLGGNDRAVGAWEAASGKNLLRRGGRWGGQLRAWMEQERDGLFLRYPGTVVSVDVSPDGKTAASASSNGTVQLWDLRTGEELKRSARAARQAYMVAFSPNGKTLAAVDEQGVYLWEPSTGKRLREWAGQGDGFVGFAEGGKALVWTSSGGGRVYVCKLAADAKPRELGSIPGMAIGGLTWDLWAAVSPNGKTLAAPDWGGTVMTWDLPSGKVRNWGITVRRGHDLALAFTSGGALLACREDDEGLVLRKADTGKVVRRWQGVAGPRVFSPDGRTLATAGREGTIHLLEVSTGKERRRFEGHPGAPWVGRFSPDGRRLVTGSDDALLVWDVTGHGPAGLSQVRLTRKELEALADDLRSTDAAQAYQAIWALAAAAEQAPAFLLARLRPTFRADARAIAGWIADLESEEFARREKAEQELARQEDLAESALRKALRGKPSLELHRRAERLLRRLEESVPSPGRLEALRAVEVLEQIGTASARRSLEVIAREAPGSRLQEEARASLQRLAGRPGGRR